MSADSATSQPQHSLRRRLFAGISWVMVGRVLSLGALFALTPILTRRLTKPELAAYVLISFLVPFVAQLVNLGSTDVLLRVIRRAHLDSNPYLARCGVFACAKLFVVSGIITSVAFAWFSRVLADGRPDWTLLSQSSLWTAAWICLYSYSQVVAEVFRGRDQFWMSTAMYTKSGGWLSNVLILIAVACAAWFKYQLDFPSLMAIHVVMNTVAVGVGVVMSYNVLRGGGPPPTQIDSLPQEGALPASPNVWWMLRESWPIFVTAATLLGIEQLDVFLVSLNATDSDVSNYGLAKRCQGLVNFAFVTLGPALTPFIAELYERRELKKLERLVRGIATLIGLPCVMLSILLFLGAGTFSRIMFGPNQVGVATPLRILLAGQIILFFAGHGHFVLIMTGRQRVLMRSTAVIGVVFAALCPVAIYFWGVAGAAVAKSLATAERAIAAAVIVRRDLGFWTTASLSPDAIKDSLNLVLRRGARRRQQEDDDPTESETL